MFKRIRWGLFIAGMYATTIASAVLVLSQDVAVSWQAFYGVAPCAFLIGLYLYSPSAGDKE